MTKTFFKLILSSILFFNIMASAETTLNAATRNNPPHYTITNDKMSGLDYELANLIFTKAGINLNYDTKNPSSWAEIIKQIRTGKKAVIGQATDTKKREKWALFSKEYRLDYNAVVAKSDKDKPFENSQEFINFIKSNKKLKIGVVNGYIYNSDSINKLIKIPGSTKIIKRQKTQDLLKMLANNKLDYIIINKLSANYLLSQTGDLNNYNIIDIKAVMPIHFMFSKKKVMQSDVDKVNSAIESSTDEITEIMKKYYN